MFFTLLLIEQEIMMKNTRGILISVNAPGHFMRLAIEKGFYKDQEQALADIRNMTIQSVGKGGYSHPEGISTTWHSESNLDRFGCPVPLVIVLITAVFIILMY